MNTKAIFLDKDGTLIENVPYNVDISKIILTEGAIEGLRALHHAGYKLIIISNQSGIAFGRFQEEDLVNVEDHLRQMLGSQGIPLEGLYYCPHHPDGKVSRYTVQCFCRKPNPGLIFRAAREHGINLGASWLIGDILNDVEAGRRADCRTILIDNGNETEWEVSPLRRPHHTVKNLWEASQIILAPDRTSKPPVKMTGASKHASSPPYLYTGS